MSELADLLERFRRGGEILAVATTGAAGAMLDFHPSEGAWSVRQIVCHVADSEVVYTMRMRQVLAEENPTLIGFDQNQWAANLDYTKRKVSSALDTFRKLRQDCYELLKELPEDAFLRAGAHSERGRVTLRDLLQSQAEHVEGHVRQIQRTRDAYREHKAQQAAAAAPSEAQPAP